MPRQQAGSQIITLFIIIIDDSLFHYLLFHYFYIGFRHLFLTLRYCTILRHGQPLPYSQLIDSFHLLLLSFIIRISRITDAAREASQVAIY